MTAWRVSVESRDGTTYDVVLDATEEATVAELKKELSAQGLDGDDLRIDGARLTERMTLDASPLRHGSRISVRDQIPARSADSPPGPGWYLVAIAGPDTGAWARITPDGISVGRRPSNSLAIGDFTLSGKHFSVRLADGDIVVEDHRSTNGTLVEGTLVDGLVTASNGTYLSAGATTFGIFRVDQAAIAPDLPTVGATAPFQRRFREAVEPLPAKLKHPSAPTGNSESARRSFMSYLVPIISSLGFAVMIGLTSSSTNMLTRLAIMLPIMALGPIFIAVDSLRRRRAQARERAEQEGAYQQERAQFLEDLATAREEERDRDRWAAMSPGMAALLTKAHFSRLWERSPADEDFCEVAIGLHNRPSAVEVEGQPQGTALRLDTQWSAFLRHSLVGEGPLAVLGPVHRARSLARALLLDLATSHSPNDVKLWLLTDADEGTDAEWNVLRWMPHTYLGDSQNRIFSTSSSRAAGLSLLRSIINERRSVETRGGVPLPVHIVVVDCIDAIEPEELTDLLVDGSPVGVVGVILDALVTPEGTSAQLKLSRFADEASFVSKSQPLADAVRSFEMGVECFASAARSMASLRPAGSVREVHGGAEVIRLVDLVGAEVDADGVDRVIDRWSTGGTCRIRVGGLGDLVTEIDIMRDGPHGLVGGTTRSGKTEFLKSLFTSLAVANHPNDLSIVIVDFKGGVDHELSAQLPHVIDLSTNHNVDSFVRTVRLIEAELERRQRAFKAVGAPNFDAYRAARGANASLLPVPRLLVVIDEFSELLSSETGKANLSSLESVTRVGGGLGVHLMLVTQNFENQLPSQIAANAGLRICFRVQEAAHSKAVLNSPEAASIPKERIGRAFLRSHGGRVVEFQAARVAGPRPGKEAATTPVKSRIVPFAALADALPGDPIVDVPAEDTDMHAVVKVIETASRRSGWTAPVVPWPKELPRCPSIGDLARSGLDWPVGLVDEPERQRQSPIGLDAHGPHTLFVGGAGARLGEVLRAVVVSGAMKRSPEALHFYVIDQLGQGLLALQVLPHVGGVAERNEPLALRILRHVAGEVGTRKSRLSELGVASVQEMRAATGDSFPDVVLVVHGADRLLMHGEAQPSPILAPLLGLLSESVGTGVRVLASGPPSIAHHRLGSSIAHRFVLESPDPQEYSALGVPRALASGLDGLGRAVDVASEHLMQFALVPSTPEVPATEVIRALGYRLTEMWQPTDGSSSRPIAVRELPWPLPISRVMPSIPPAGVEQPVALSVDTETGELSWLDADEDGPAFVVCGSTRGGRSNALVAAATIMAEQGWKVLGLPLSRRSPLANGAFPGSIVGVDDLKADADSPRPVALFIDDAHKWSGEVDGLRALLDGSGDRAVVVAGPTDYFAGRSDLVRALPSRCALVLAPRGGMDASHFGVRRLSDEVLRDSRPGRGVLVVAGEIAGAQVPLAI